MNNIINRLTLWFPAFQERNFRLYTNSQLLSFIGTWFQATGAAVLIYQLTGSKEWTAGIAAMITLPGLLSPIGGTIIDRFGARKIMYWTNSVVIPPSLMLGFLTIAHRINKWEILAVAVIGGLINAFDSPARQAIIRDCMPQKSDDIRSAISLNTAFVHTTQFVGPALAGIAIPLIGVGWTFIINALSFIPVLIALRMMRIDPHPHHNGIPFWTMMTDGWRYTFGHKDILFLTTFYAFAGMFGYSFRGIIPGIAHDFFHAPLNNVAPITGTLTAASGIGAGLGAIIASALHNASTRRFLFLGSLFMGASLAIFSINRNLAAGIVLLGISGFGFTMCTSPSRATLQTLIAQKMQARVMSIVVTAFFVGMGSGTYIIGVLVEHLGITPVLMGNGIALLMLAAMVKAMGEKVPESPKEVPQIV